MVDGSLREQDRITTTLLGGSESFTVQELGLLAPRQLRTGALFAGLVSFWDGKGGDLGSIVGGGARRSIE